MGEVFKRARMTTPCIVVLEDLDSMIDNKNRSFFLNELDGFRANTGVVVLATTNHPQRLDPSILERPSRFDRKYYFELPAERNGSRTLRSGMRNSNRSCVYREVQLRESFVRQEGFSFAYLKELFVAAMVQWMSSRRERINGRCDIRADRAASRADESKRKRKKKERNENQ